MTETLPEVVLVYVPDPLVAVVDCEAEKVRDFVLVSESDLEQEYDAVPVSESVKEPERERVRDAVRVSVSERTCEFDALPLIDSDNEAVAVHEPLALGELVPDVENVMDDEADKVFVLDTVRLFEELPEVE